MHFRAGWKETYAPILSAFGHSRNWPDPNFPRCSLCVAIGGVADTVCYLICPTSAVREFLSTLARKNNSVFQKRNLVYGWHIPLRLQRGVSRSSRDVRRGCGGRGGIIRRTMPTRTAKPCGPGAPTQVPSWRQCFSHCADDGDKKARSHRGDHGVSRKPLRREGRLVAAYLW